MNIYLKTIQTILMGVQMLQKQWAERWMAADLRHKVWGFKVEDARTCKRPIEFFSC